MFVGRLADIAHFSLLRLLVAVGPNVKILNIFWIQERQEMGCCAHGTALPGK